MTPRTLFYCALMRLDALNAERWAITGDLQTELNALIVAEARKLKPKSKKLKAPAPPSLFARPEGTYADMAFANGVVGTERCDELAKPFLDRQTEEHAKIDTQVKETKETLALAAEEAPIEPGEPGELRLYERVWSSTYSTQGYGAISYARRDAETALAHALRYGVMGEIRETERTKGWSGTDSCTFEVWVQVKGQLDVEILTRKPPPPYAEQVRDCWARGCNPRVLNPFLPHGFEEKIGIDYFGKVVDQEKFERACART